MIPGVGSMQLTECEFVGECFGCRQDTQNAIENFPKEGSHMHMCSPACLAKWSADIGRLVSTKEGG